METILAKAVNQKNQKLFNKSIKLLIRYNELNDLRDRAGDNDDEKSYKKYDRMCEVTYDKFLDSMDALPKYEQKRIYDSELY
jgi:hypothetical protein